MHAIYGARSEVDIYHPAIIIVLHRLANLFVYHGFVVAIQLQPTPTTLRVSHFLCLCGRQTTQIFAHFDIRPGHFVLERKFHGGIGSLGPLKGG